MDFNVIVTFLNEAPNGEKINGFQLEKGNEKYSLFILEEYNFEKLKPFFKRRVNQRGFHESFKALKKLGKGNFAHVYLVEDKITNEKYAVKAFNKESTYSQKNGKVDNFAFIP